MKRKQVEILYEALLQHTGFSLCPSWSAEECKDLNEALIDLRLKLLREKHTNRR